MIGRRGLLKIANCQLLNLILNYIINHVSRSFGIKLNNNMMRDQGIFFGFGWRLTAQQILSLLQLQIIKYMGCGACSNSQVSDSKRSLHQSLNDKANALLGSGRMAELKSFISVEEIKAIENATEPLRETIRLEELQRFEAGETALLSKQRRTAWKLAIYQHIKPGKIQTFCEHPTANNEQTKNRFYQISLDVKRTFPTVGQLNRDHLSNVLENVTLNFEGVGYTQGMNFFVGFLLLCGFSPAEAYEFFVRLGHNGYFLLIRNFSQNFKNANCCVSIMQEVMKQNINPIFAEIICKIESFGMNLFLFVFSWFLTYFLYNFNVKASILIWDYILLFPSTINVSPTEIPVQVPSKSNYDFGCGFVNCINLGVRILQSLSKELLSCVEPSQMMSILRHDSIEAHLDEAKTQELIFICRANPVIDWNLFKAKCAAKDEELLKIISDLQSSDQSKGHFISFMNQCMIPKRSQPPSFQ